MSFCACVSTFSELGLTLKVEGPVVKSPIKLIMDKSILNCFILNAKAEFYAKLRYMAKKCNL